MPEALRPLSIGLLTHSVHPRGGVVHTLELAAALTAAGHAVTVIAPARPGQRMFREMPCEVALAKVEADEPDTVSMVRARVDAFRRHLAPRLARRPFDLLHAQDSIGGNALADLEDAGLIGPWLRTVHHLDSFSDARLAAWQLRAFERARTLLCVSPLWRAHLAAEHGREALEIVNGVDGARYDARPREADARLAQRLGIRPGAPVVLAVGGVEARKNTLELLRAFARLRDSHPRAQLVIAGGASLLDHSGYAAAFRERLAAFGWAAADSPEVRLTGPLADADMPGLFRLADVVAMPSLREGFGLVVLEALASGVPVAVSRIAPFVDHLAPEDASWCDPSDPASIARALEEAIAGRDATRIAGSFARLAARFSWAASARRHEEIYRAHLAAAGPRPASPARVLEQGEPACP